MKSSQKVTVTICILTIVLCMVVISCTNSFTEEKNNENDNMLSTELSEGQAMHYNPSSYRKTGEKPKELPVTISYEDTQNVPRDIYDFAINFMRTREISEAKASQYVRFFGEYGDFMMGAMKESLSWAGEWSIDRFEKVDDNLYLFYQHYVEGYDPDEEYTGPPRPRSSYTPLFIYITNEEKSIVFGYRWLPQEYRDKLNPDDFPEYYWDTNLDDINDVEDIIRFQDITDTND